MKFSICGFLRKDRLLLTVITDIYEDRAAAKASFLKSALDTLAYIQYIYLIKVCIYHIIRVVTDEEYKMSLVCYSCCVIKTMQVNNAGKKRKT